jgi:hypothetical protein
VADWWAMSASNNVFLDGGKIMAVQTCSQCGYVIVNPSQPCPSCGNKVPNNSEMSSQAPQWFVENNFSHATIPNGEIGMKQRRYKVLTQKDKWFSSKFDPNALEGALNAYAEQGWRVISCATAEIPGIFGGTNREEMIIIMEREA